MNNDFSDRMIYCPNCGTPNGGASRFCENCGFPLDEAAEAAAAAASGDPSGGPGRRFSPVMIAVAVVVLLAAGAAFWFIMNHDSENGSDSDAGDNGTTAAEESADPENFDQGEGVITDLEEGDVTVIASDWDWDSAYHENSSDMYRVDAILYVKNDLDRPITGIDFAVLDKNWDAVEDDSEPDEGLSATGYIDAGSKGIMVGKVWSYRNKVRPNDDTYQITAAYTNDGLTGYIVPSGRVTNKYGPNGDYYDVALTNPNDTDVDQDSIVVAVKISGDKIKDSDATGRLDRPIPAYTDSFTQKKAFNDPNLLTDPNELEVYVIDEATLNNQ